MPEKPWKPKKLGREQAKPHRVIFRDAKGRFVKSADRYSEKVKSVQVYRGVRAGRYVTIIETTQKHPITPRRFVDLVTREEFESLPPVYGATREEKPKARKYVAWDLAGKIISERGVKGKRLRITLQFKHGSQKKQLQFYFQPKKSARAVQNQTALWSAIVRALGMENASEYEKIGSRFLEDRRGTTKVRLTGATIDRLIL